MIRAEQPQRQWADRSRTVLAGQSLGGISALMGLVTHRKRSVWCSSHSPSMWWTPEEPVDQLVQRNRYLMGE